MLFSGFETMTICNGAVSIQYCFKHASAIFCLLSFSVIAINLQDWKFIAITEKDRRQNIAEACLKQYWMETAPLHIVIVSNPEKSIHHYGEKGMKYAIMNCSAVAE